MARGRTSGATAYFTGEPTLNIVHQQFVKPDGVSYTTQKEAGREQTEFMRSKDLWFRPIETRVGPDGALYVVDFYNQAVIHNDTRGPLHGPANAASARTAITTSAASGACNTSRPENSTCRTSSRADLPGLIRIMQTSPNAHVKETAWRLAQENYASDQRLAQIKPAHGQQGFQTLRAGAHGHDGRRAKGACSTPSRRPQTTGRDPRWSLPPPNRPPTYVSEALAYERPQALTDFVTACPARGAARTCRALLVAAAGSRAGRGRAEGWRRASDCADGQRGDYARRPDHRSPADAARRSGDEGRGAAVVAKWDKAGALRAKADGYVRSRCCASCEMRTTSDVAPHRQRRRACWRVPARRAEALSAIAPDAVRRGHACEPSKRA